jgi:hypothetical protein
MLASLLLGRAMFVLPANVTVFVHRNGRAVQMVTKSMGEIRRRQVVSIEQHPNWRVLTFRAQMDGEWLMMATNFSNVIAA